MSNQNKHWIDVSTLDAPIVCTLAVIATFIYFVASHFLSMHG